MVVNGGFGIRGALKVVQPIVIYPQHLPDYHTTVVLGSVQDTTYRVTCGRTVVLRSGGGKEEGNLDFDVVLVEIERVGA